MEFDKSQILEMLQSLGKHDEAGKAQSELPEKVDTERDGDMLSRLGIDPKDLISKFGGNLPGGLGGLLGR